MWEINSLEQIFAFLYSLCLGGIFCIFYDFFRAIRATVKLNDFSVFVQDVLYFFIFGFVSFLYLLSTTNGEIRGYIIFGTAIGFLLCYYTFSKIFLKLLKVAFKGFVTVFGKINAFSCNIFSKIEYFFQKNLILIKNTCKKVLKMVKGLLYTKK